MVHRRAEMGKKVGTVADVLGDAHPDIMAVVRLANACDDADSDEALDDVEAKLTLRFDDELTAAADAAADAAEAAGKGAAKHRRPLKRTQYAHHCKKGVRDLLALYGAAPERLAMVGRCGLTLSNPR
jgi:transcription elongation factor SPT6